MNLKQDFHIYNPSKHRDAIYRIYAEVGWFGEGKEEVIDILLSAGEGWVSEIEGHAESIAHTTPGLLRYLEEELPTSCVTSVATSLIARKRGIATHLTAHAVAQDAMKGAMVSLIGVFEQGFYDQLGFGTGGYEHLVAFDPAKLNVESSRRIPKRLNKDDYENIHQSRLQRMHSHGSLDILPHEITHSMIEEKKGFGLGFYDGPDGSLSHHMWLVPKNVERGPYFIWWMAYQSYEQFLELLSILKSLGDQVHLIRVLEPQGIQFQDLLKQPLKERFVSSKSNFESGIRSLAYWQIRICDLQGCLNRTHLHKTDLHFNLVLEDPITKCLPSDYGWQGLSGNYVIHLGSHSSSEPGQDPILPTLKASIGAFSRMWMGIRPSSGLSVTDILSGPPELLSQLDDAFRLPNPKPDWDF